MDISTGNSTDDTGPYSLLLLREEELRQAGVIVSHEGSIVVNNASGTDTINLAAVATNTILNVNGGMAGTAAGDMLTIAGGLIIESVYLGAVRDASYHAVQFRRRRR